MTNNVTHQRRNEILEYIDDEYPRYKFNMVLEGLRDLMFFKDKHSIHDRKHIATIIDDDTLMKRFTQIILRHRRTFSIYSIFFSMNFIPIDIIIKYYDLFLEIYIDDSKEILNDEDDTVQKSMLKIKFITEIFLKTRVKKKGDIEYLLREFNNNLSCLQREPLKIDEFLAYVYSSSTSYDDIRVKEHIILEYNLFPKTIDVKRIDFNNLKQLFQFYNKYARIIYNNDIYKDERIRCVELITSIKASYIKASFDNLLKKYNDGFTKKKYTHIINCFWIKIINSLIIYYLEYIEKYEDVYYLQFQTEAIIKRHNINYTRKQHYFECIDDDNIDNIIYYGFLKDISNNYNYSTKFDVKTFYSDIICALFNTYDYMVVTTYTIEHFCFITDFILKRMTVVFETELIDKTKMILDFIKTIVILMYLWDEPTINNFDYLYDKYFNILTSHYSGVEKDFDYKYSIYNTIFKNKKTSVELFKYIIRKGLIDFNFTNKRNINFDINSYNICILYEILMDDELYNEFIGKNQYLRYPDIEFNGIKVEGDNVKVQYCSDENFSSLYEMIRRVYENLNDRDKCVNLAKKYIFMSITSIKLNKNSSCKTLRQLYRKKLQFNNNIVDTNIMYGFVFRNKCLRHEDYKSIYDYSKYVERYLNNEISKIDGSCSKHMEFDMFYMFNSEGKDNNVNNIIFGDILNGSLRYFYNLISEKFASSFDKCGEFEGMSIVERIIYILNNCNCNCKNTKTTLFEIFDNLLSSKIVLDGFDYDVNDFNTILKYKKERLINFSSCYLDIYSSPEIYLMNIFHTKINIKNNRVGKIHRLQEDFYNNMYQKHLKAFFCQNRFVTKIYYNPHTEIGKRKLKRDYEKMMSELGEECY